MLNTQLVADFLQEKLNAATQQHKFKIFAEVGEDKGADIPGILRTIEAPQSPVESYVDVKYVLECTFLVYCARTNRNYIEVNEIVSSVIKELNGTIQDFGSGKGIMTFTEPVPGKFDVNYGAGGEIPLRFTVNITYTESGTVTSADKKWYLDGVLIPYLSESVTIQTEGYTRKIFTEQYSKTLKTGQTRFYTFEVPETSEIGQNINALILNNNISATHTLKLIDGVTYTENNPFQTNVIVYTSGTVKSVKPNASSITITFTDTGVNTEYPMYQLGLVDFPFDRQGEDTRYFNSVDEQKTYFAELISKGAPYNTIPAPNLNSINISRQVYPNNTNKDLLFLTAKNYAVIKIMTTAQSTPQYLYFFITNCEVGEGGQVMYDLELDTVQTYFFDPNIKFADCLIERAHLNRFEKVGSDTVKFVTDPASKIYNAEDALNFPKRLTKRTRIGLQHTGNAEVDNWLNTYVDYWVYVFIKSDQKYSASGTREFSLFPMDVGTTYDEYSDSLNRIMDLPYACFCFPVIQDPLASFAVRKNGVDVVINEGSEIYAQSLGIFPSFAYVKKASIISPFNYPEQVYINDFEIKNWSDETGNYTQLIFKNFGELDRNHNLYIKTPDNFSAASDVLLFLSNQSITSVATLFYELPQNNNILISDIKNGANRLLYNPKLNSQNFKELIINASSGNEFAYDIQKLQNNQIQFLYNEPLQPEITKYYMRVSPVGLYVDGTDKNYTGLVGSNDTSIPYVVEQYQNFIANNKNFWMQSDMKIVSGATKSIVGFGASAISGKVNPAQGIMTGIDLATSIIDRNMTIDNMKNAPAQLKNANGSIIFNISITNLGLYVEEWSALDGDIQTGFDFMELYGFAVNAIDNIKDYVNIRKYHNYVKAQIQAITGGSMSNVSRENLRQRFSQGIRFWNVDTPDYTNENYENWLDGNSN